MNNDLIDEINQIISFLIDSGFFDKDEILDIIEEQFIFENISLEKIANIISKKYDEKIDDEKNWSSLTDFDRLVNCFDELNKNDIIAIHNAGNTITDGIEDSFEVFHHLKSQKINAKWFCFYNLQDIEIAIKSNSLNLGFGDFENNTLKSLEIGKTITKILKNNGFSIEWNEDINQRIKIQPFYWKKRFDNKEYEMEGAFNSFLKNNQKT